jgi:tripartite-type tricarboxylate transporter receptor subunit TctC
MAVVNRAGGAGTIGTAEIVNARPDGYTIGVSSGGPLTIKPHQMKLPYKTPDDYTSIALIGYQAEVLSVSVDTPFKTLKDLVEYAKANPGKLRVATTGAGGLADLILEQLKFLAQIDMSDVPSKSGGEQIALLLGKHVDAIVTTTLEILPQVQAGKVRSLALADEKRSPMLPEVPTFKESGYDITLLAFSCLIGPKGLSVEVISRLQEGCAKVCKDVNFIKQMENQGFTVLYESTEDLKKRLWKDYNLNKKLLEHMEGKK